MDQTVLDSVLAQLNPEQRDAVNHIVSGWQTQNGNVRITIVDGPPGTGKTHVAAATAGEWIRRRGTQVAILTPTHRAALRAMEALSSIGFDREANEILYLPPDQSDSLPPHVLRIRRQARVLVTTWHGCQRAFGSWGQRILSHRSLLLFDEVSQIPFSAFLSVMRKAYSVVGRGSLGGIALIGDPHQLPVVTSQDVLATNASLGILRRHPECVPHRLILQHRMNSPICEIVNVVRQVAFAGTPLTPADETVALRTLDRLTPRCVLGSQEFAEVLDPRYPVVFVDTTRFAADLGLRESSVGGSWVYEAEAQLSCRLAASIQQVYGISPTVLSPYRAQTVMMRKSLGMDALTIYRAQGHEWDCVILTLGRTRIPGRSLLDEVYQQTYVGLSRARAKLIVLLNTSTFRNFPLWGALLNAGRTISGVRVVEAHPAWVEA